MAFFRFKTLIIEKTPLIELEFLYKKWIDIKFLPLYCITKMKPCQACAAYQYKNKQKTKKIIGLSAEKAVPFSEVSV